VAPRTTQVAVEVFRVIGLRATQVALEVLRRGDPLFILPTTLPDAFKGHPYSQQLTTNRGTCVFSVVGGFLPPTFSLSSTGLLLGNPPPGRLFLEPAVLSLALADQPYTEQIRVVEEGVEAYSFVVKAVDPLADEAAVQDYVLNVRSSIGPWVFTGGCLPACLALGPDGSIGGVPMTVGDYPLNVRATDAVGTVVAHQYTLIVRSPS